MIWVLIVVVIIVIAYLGVRRLPGERPANERWGPEVGDPYWQEQYNREAIDGSRDPDNLENLAREGAQNPPQEW